MATSASKVDLTRKVFQQAHQEYTQGNHSIVPPHILEVFQRDVSDFMKPNLNMNFHKHHLYKELPEEEKQFLVFQEAGRIFQEILDQLSEHAEATLSFVPQIHDANTVIFRYTCLIDVVVRKQLDKLGIGLELTEKQESFGRMQTIVTVHQVEDPISMEFI